MCSNFNKISFDDAYERLLTEFPEQVDKILINPSRFKVCLNILRGFYRLNDIYLYDSDGRQIMKRFSDFFYPEKDFITEFAYKYFCIRIKEFTKILDKAKDLNTKFPDDSVLTSITSVCPSIIQNKKEKNKDNRLQLSNLIRDMDYFYIRVPQNTQLILNNYCWLLGDYYTKEKIKSYRITIDDFLEECSLLPNQWGYKDSIILGEIDDTFSFYRLDTKCFGLQNNGILINKIFLKEENISIDCINGGVLTTFHLIPDFFYYVKKPFLVRFEDIYVNEQDAKNKLYLIQKSKADCFDNYTVDVQRLNIIRYAIENHILDNYLKYYVPNGIPVYQNTKEHLFNTLANCNKISNKFNNKNKKLFNVNANDFFKGNQDIKKIISFRVGRPRKI